MFASPFPEGANWAVRTFNPRLGIVGGLSILGTTGKERPYSVPALEESLEMRFSGGISMWGDGSRPGSRQYRRKSLLAKISG